MKLRRMIVVAVIGSLLSACAFTDQFYSPSDVFEPIEGVDHRSIWFEYQGSRIHTLLLEPDQKIANQRVLILIQGKGGNASDWYKFAVPIVEAGYHVWIPEYPGHGKSEGQPDHKSVYNAMNAVVEEMLEHNAIEDYKKAFWGFSLGANLATRLAVNYQDSVEGVIIDGGGSAFEDVAVGAVEGGSFWVRLFVASPYPARDNVKELNKGKTLIIHSVDDQVMPIEMGRLIHENAANETKIWEVPGEHCMTVFNEPEEYTEQLDWIFQ
ncbi:alpha/beta hydrolase [Spirochaeta dissipatitropha]